MNPPSSTDLQKRDFRYPEQVSGFFKEYSKLPWGGGGTFNLLDPCRFEFFLVRCILSHVPNLLILLT